MPPDGRRVLNSQGTDDYVLTFKQILLILIANDHRETINAFAQIYRPTCKYDTSDFSNVLKHGLPPLGAGLAHPLKYRSIFPK